MLHQTKRYHEILKNAGLKRKDYRVRTPYDKTKGGWGLTEIYIRNAEAMTEEVINNLLQHDLKITKAVFKDGKYFYSVEPHDKPKYKEYHVGGKNNDND